VSTDTEKVEHEEDLIPWRQKPERPREHPGGANFGEA
jgi:hypothetical protein